MSRLIAVNIGCFFDSRMSPFVEFDGLESFLSRFGLDVRSSVLVWRVFDLLNPDSSLDVRLIVRPIGWSADMIEYWTKRLTIALENDV